jgi:hypothetical protein
VQKNSLRGCCVLIPRTCEYVTLYGKGEFRVQVELMLLSADLKIGRLPKFNAITGSLKVKDGGRRNQSGELM